MFTEDLAPYFDLGDFAVSARYDSKVDVPVIFDRSYLQQLGLVAGAAPSALGRAADFASTPVGKTLAIDGTTYTIRSSEPQDDGAVVLLRLEA